MSRINLFLQKRKMHENHHGIIMVFTAYVLSFLMLVIGSDVFYNNRTVAARISNETNEEAQETENNEILDPENTSLKTQVLQKNLINPYGIEEYLEPENIRVNSWSNPLGEAKLLLSLDMELQENNYLMERKRVFNVLSKDQDKELGKEEEIVESLSISTEIESNIKKATKDEIVMLERIVEAEATGEDMVGKILIANVIFNRITDEEFPDSIEKVIFQKVSGDYQFSPISDKRFWSVKVTKETKEAVRRALEGEDYSEGALYFMARKRAKKSSVKWFDGQLEWIFKHGGHEFYKNI